MLHRACSRRHVNDAHALLDAKPIRAHLTELPSSSDVSFLAAGLARSDASEWPVSEKQETVAWMGGQVWVPYESHPTNA